MAKFRIEDFFSYNSTNPSALKNGNIIMFSYKSPHGVNDKKPLVYVTEKLGDRFYGINLHYDMSEMEELVENLNAKILPFLEKEYFKKYPENKQKLKETKQKFNKSLITEIEYKEMMKRYPKNELELFKLQITSMEFMRCYKYDRVNSCSKLVWKV